MTTADEEKAAALLRKRKRLEAWKKRQANKAAEAAKPKPTPKVTLSLGGAKKTHKKKKKKRPLGFVGFGGDDEGSGISGNQEEKKSIDLIDISMTDVNDSTKGVDKGDKSNQSSSSSPLPAKKKRRWDSSSSGATVTKPSTDASKSNPLNQEEDGLDKFMDALKSGAMGKVEIQQAKDQMLSIDVSGSMMRQMKPIGQNGARGTPVSGGVITPEELAKLTGDKEKRKPSRKEEGAFYGPSDWETSASEVSYSLE